MESLKPFEENVKKKGVTKLYGEENLAD